MQQLKNNKVLIATKNRGKVKEFKDYFNEMNIDVQSLSDFSDLPDIIEDGQTFAENARKKARVIAEHLQMPVLADDSGLCVDALDGNPGVFSARYAGEQATDEMNNRKLLSDLQSAEVKTGDSMLSPARFICALALFDPKNGQVFESEGACPGFITDTPKGTNGFGYDPLFYLPQYGKTMAEISIEDKNQISHRGEAIRKLLTLL